MDTGLFGAMVLGAILAAPLAGAVLAGRALGLPWRTIALWIGIGSLAGAWLAVIELLPWLLFAW